MAVLALSLVACGTTEPETQSVVGDWSLVRVTNGDIQADSVAGQWSFRSDGTQSGWSFIRNAFDVDRAWSGTWDLTGSTLHVTSVFSVPVPPPGFDPPSGSVEYTVSLRQDGMGLRSTRTDGTQLTLELVRR